MLRLAWFLVLEKCEGLGDIFKHRDVDAFVCAVPVNVHAKKVAVPSPVLRALVVFTEDCGEMLDVFTIHLLNAKMHDAKVLA